MPMPRKTDAVAARYSSCVIDLRLLLWLTSYTKNFPENTTPIASNTTASWLYSAGLTGGEYTSYHAVSGKEGKEGGRDGDKGKGRGSARRKGE